MEWILKMTFLVIFQLEKIVTEIEAGAVVANRQLEEAFGRFKMLVGVCKVTRELNVFWTGLIEVVYELLTSHTQKWSFTEDALSYFGFPDTPTYLSPPHFIHLQH